MERHLNLKSIARSVYVVPGMKSATRIFARGAAQYLPLSNKNRWRLHNFFGEDTQPDGPILCSMPIPSRGRVRLELNLGDYLSRVWYYLGYSGYEKSTTDLLCALLKTKSCMVDVGANIGFYTVLAATLLENRGEVYAFEPWSEMSDRLARNLHLNNFQNTRLNRMAVSGENGWEKLFLPTDSSWTTASLVKGFMGMHQQEYQEVETIRLDTYCANSGITKIDILRIDAEGAELKVLQSLGALLDVWLPDLIFEVLTPYDAALNEFFLGKPYRKFLITDHSLEEVSQIIAHPQHRDFYLSCAPVLQ